MMQELPRKVVYAQKNNGLRISKLDPLNEFLGRSAAILKVAIAAPMSKKQKAGIFVANNGCA